MCFERIGGNGRRGDWIFRLCGLMYGKSGGDVDGAGPGFCAVDLGNAYPVWMTAGRRGVFLETEFYFAASTDRHLFEYGGDFDTACIYAHGTIRNFFEGDLVVHHAGLEVEHGFGGCVQGEDNAVCIAGGDGFPGDGSVRGFLDALGSGVEGIAFGVEDFPFVQGEATVPADQAVAGTDALAGPGYADFILFALDGFREGVDEVQVSEDVHAFNGGRAGYGDGDVDGAICLEVRTHGLSVGGYVQEDALPCGAVTAAGFERFPESGAGEFFCIDAGETAVYTKGAGAAVGSAGSAFVVIATGGEAHTVAFFEGFFQEPFEFAPF